ncbi:Hypothetical protein Minf_0498 [Methylacidiphilum infernorum V4]|uniref:Uncharacterized protein n=1 Tax=Methylacidiphilum infernorum (isolate V4) TaxID=481448 RepID=B3DZD9_METI4|nr:Hypothetical protein Minf_0498 [Methylacidiphilum infernorum V4]
MQALIFFDRKITSLFSYGLKQDPHFRFVWRNGHKTERRNGV